MNKNTQKKFREKDWPVFKEFMTALDELEKIVSNRNGIGSIGEYIAQKIYNFQLNTNKRERGYDGTIGETKVEVKVHDSEKRTNIQIKKNHKFDDLIVVVGSNSKLFIPSHGSNNIRFQIYYFKDYKGYKRHKGYKGCNVGVTMLREKYPEYLVTSEGQIINVKDNYKKETNP